MDGLTYKSGYIQISEYSSRAVIGGEIPLSKTYSTLLHLLLDSKLPQKYACFIWLSRNLTVLLKAGGSHLSREGKMGSCFQCPSSWCWGSNMVLLRFNCSRIGSGLRVYECVCIKSDDKPFSLPTH